MAEHHYGSSKYSSWGAWSCSFALLSFSLVISGIAFLVCGITIARPGLKALQYQEATCKVEGHKFLQTLSCSCQGLNNKPLCKSRFPCVQIYVSYLLPLGNQSYTKIETLLNENEQTETSEYKECSVYSCVYEKKTNEHVINSFFQSFGQQGDNFTCYYDTAKPSVVIAERSYTRAEVITSLVLPGIVFLLLLFALIIACLVKCRSRKKREAKPPKYRSYMNPTVLRESIEPAEIPLPSCCTSMTYMRQSDPVPPRKMVAHTL